MMTAKLYESAIKYVARGWSIIPIGRDKKAAVKWTRFQKTRATKAQLRDWLVAGRGIKGPITGIAAICGQLSGDLVVRDFDSMKAYQAWAKGHPTLAATLPTVETARGRHVYLRNGHSRITNLGDGELRGSGYVLLPPS